MGNTPTVHSMLSWNQLSNHSNADNYDHYNIPTADEDSYVTHTPISLESYLKELDPRKEKDPKEEEIPEEVPPEQEAVPPEGQEAVPPEGQEAGEEVPQEAGEEGMPEEPGGMGDEEETPESPKEVGRIYELKKIHSRLIAIESYLSTSSDGRVYKLKGFVSKSIDLFNTLISNVQLYKDKLDDIIILYYKFIKYVYTVLQKHLRKKKGKGEDEF